MVKTLKELLSIKNQGTMKLAVVVCQDYEVLKAVDDARKLGIAEPILIGDIEKTKDIIRENRLNLMDCQMIDEKDLKKSAEIGVKCVSGGNADFIMKGLVDTSILLKEVLNKDYGLRTEGLLSHVMIYEVPTYHKLIYLTDGGMNLEPDLEDKVKIINNCVKVCKALGNDVVKVAALAAKEKVNPKMKATVDADELKKMCLEGKFENGVIVDGSIRDCEQIGEMDISVYAKGVSPNGPYKNGPGEIGTVISFAGQVVHPGDIVVGDQDGIVFIRPSEAKRLAEQVEKVEEKEQKILKDIFENHSYDRPWVDEILTQINCEIL